MVAQLDRLATVVGMPNVRIGAIPLGVEIPTSPPEGGVRPLV
jgi:hypothetical protein